MRHLALVGLFACASKAPPAPAPTTWSDEWLLAQGQKFLGDTPQRRAALEASLTNHENLYSRQRLMSYALGDRGWDLLPVWNPRSRPVDAAIAGELVHGNISVPPDQGPLWDGTTPTTMAEWIALGRRVFLGYPMRAEVFMEYALTQPELAASVGIERAADGSIPGLVVFQDVDGEQRVGISCAICHASVRDGAVVLGRARRTFDYGRLRVTYDQIHGVPTDPNQMRRMASWGPGRADVTEDTDEDPVSIPDLWGLRHQRWLTQAGTIKHDSPLALAIRQETQLVDSNHQLIRPPRELAWALAMFIYSLEPPARPVASSPAIARGEQVFEKTCKKCHANASHGGALIAATTIATDPALATGRGRGTGKYRVPGLVRVADGAPYLHHGAVGSLAELLSPARLEKTPGHIAGTDLSNEDRDALLAFLGTL